MKDQIKRYVNSLEKTIQNNHDYLKETIEDFQEMCKMATLKKNLLLGMMGDVRETYHEIQSRLTEIRAIEQLLLTRYRQYYQRKPLRDREIMGYQFIAKNCYSKFKFALMEVEARERAKAIEKDQALKTDRRGIPFQWFHLKENQVTFIRNLRILSELDYESPSGGMGGERREVAQTLRSMTLFVFKGNEKDIGNLHSRIRLREHDILERVAREEIHGVLTHLREMDSLEVEKLFQRLMKAGGFSTLKCLLLPIRSTKDLGEEIWDLVKRTLEEMTEGEVKTLLKDKEHSA